MNFPDFFAQVPSLTLRDPLADILGAATDGLLEYHYVDAVKLAGHSCPTVAGAWLMASRAMAALYPETLPERGNIRVELRANLDTGVAGVVGSVLGLITGAATEGGFKGLGGHHGRRNLLQFGAEIDAEAKLTRLDTGTAVLLDYHPEAVQPAPEMPPLMARIIGGVASSEEREIFAGLWQDRVRRILLQAPEQSAVLTLRNHA